MGCQCFDSCTCILYFMYKRCICNCHIIIVKSMLNTATMACMEKPAKLKRTEITSD